MKPYVIVAPDLTNICAGITALHRLCDRLNTRGYEAYITGRGGWADGYRNIKYLDGKSQEELSCLQHEGIVVYPDIVAGNPLMFNNVVKWWLAQTGNSPEHEESFSYSPNHNIHASAKHNLCIWHIEDYFKLPEVENRTVTCCRIHKGAALPRIPETSQPNCMQIAGQYSRPALAQLLQSSSIFYSYDDLSMISIEARLCGCPVKIIGYTCLDKEHLVNSPFSNWAQAIPGEEVDLPKLKSEIPLFIENYRKMLEKSERELDTFIEITQSMNRPYKEDIVMQTPQTWLPIRIFPRR